MLPCRKLYYVPASGFLLAHFVDSGTLLVETKILRENPMDLFNRLSIVMAAVLRSAALGVGGIAIGCWFIVSIGIVDTRGGYVPVFGLMITTLICVAIELATAYYLSFVPKFEEPPKPVGWRPPPEEKRGKHDGPWQ